MSTGVSPSQVIQLYRNLLRYSRQLKLTDKKYFVERIKVEFRNNKDQRSPKQIEFLFKKGEFLLTKKRIC